MNRITVGVDVREWRRGTSTGISRVLTRYLNWAGGNTSHRYVLFGNQETEIRTTAACEVVRRPQGNTLYWDHMVLATETRRAGVDVFWSPNYKVPLLAGCPVVNTIHDLIPFVAPSGALDPGTPGTRGRKRWMQLLARRAARVVTDSHNSQCDLQRVLGIPEGKIRVVPVGMDPDWATDSSDPKKVARARQRYALPDREFLFYVGRYDPHKNVGVLVEAWQALPTALRSRYPLVLAGSGAQEFIGAPIEGIHTVGFVDEEDLATLFSLARAFAFPSCYEGFGLPPLEAMACGIPATVANASSLPEVTGDAALLVDPGDARAWTAALVQALTDDEFRTVAIERGHARVNEFAPERTSPKLAEVLESCVGGA